MIYPKRFSSLPIYAFPRLRALLDGHPAGGEPIAMTIGEPKHPFPDWVGAVLAENLDGFARYPENNGTAPLLKAIQGWISRRYGVDLDTSQIMALNGTREGLYNAAMALVPEGPGHVILPNPFYQVYAVAALSVGATPVFVPATEETGNLPDFNNLPTDILNSTRLAYVCSPANPQGAIATADYWAELFELAERYDFRVMADECYSEIYRDTPPVGALEVAAAQGTDPERLMVFHSLSKRSNMPGLRSGFVAGGSKSIERMRLLRSYSGAPLPEPLQAVAVRAWSDEAHVAENRALYQEKYALADRILGDVPGYHGPEGGFFLWLPVEDGEAAALKLWRETGVRVLPGAYLGREVDGKNPGTGFIRVAMVAPPNEIERGLTELRRCIYDE